MRTRWRAYCILRYGIHARLSNAEIGTESASKMPGTMIAACPYASAQRGRSTATSTANATELPSSRVNAFWNSASWSGSDCWMNLSAIPKSFNQLRLMTTDATTPQRPNSARVRKAATTTRWTTLRALSPIWKPELMSVPRAAVRRRLPVPSGSRDGSIPGRAASIDGACSRDSLIPVRTSSQRSRRQGYVRGRPGK